MASKCFKKYEVSPVPPKRPIYFFKWPPSGPHILLKCPLRGPPLNSSAPQVAPKNKMPTQWPPHEFKWPKRPVYNRKCPAPGGIYNFKWCPRGLSKSAKSSPSGFYKDPKTANGPYIILMDLQTAS